MNTMNVEKFNSESGILLNTHYAIEDFNLTWKLANFSQVFDTVHAEFCLKNNSTKWQLRLVDKRFIYLCRLDQGEPVNVDLKYCLTSIHKKFEGESFHKILGNKSVEILRLDAYECDDLGRGRKISIEFENDLLQFWCTMKVVGPAITKVSRSNDFLKPNLEKLSEDMKKLLFNRDHCDLTILTGPVKLPVHKAILCARSKVFERMFQTDMLESKNQIIELHDLHFEIVNDFVTFLYTGEVQMLSIEKAMNLYYVADRYEVQDLREKCSSYLEYNLNIEDVCTVLNFAELHRDDKLMKAAIFYIQMHASAIKFTDGWKQFCKNNPKLALNILK